MGSGSSVEHPSRENSVQGVSRAASTAAASVAASDCVVYPAFDPVSQRRSTVTVPNTNTVYKHGGPSVHADEVYGCFTTTMTIDEKKRKKGKKGKEEKNAAGEELQVASPPGFLYRLVNHSQGRWYFYNDTKDYVMVVTGYFGPKSLMTCLPPAKMWREMPSGLVLMELVVEPLKTVPMLEGEPKDGFDLRFNAVPVKEAGHLV